MSFKTTAFALLLILFSLYMSHSKAIVTTSQIKAGQSINVSQTMVSPNGKFELGFFRPENEIRYFVGIWFTNISDRERSISELNCVWVANRDYPALTSSATLSVHSNNGNIVISDGKMLYKVTNVTSSASNRAEVLNSGNLALFSRGSDNKSRDHDGSLLWQSFDHPTNTLLPGTKIAVAGDSSPLMVSWKSEDDPLPGRYSLRLVKSRISIMEGNKTIDALEEYESMLYYKGGYFSYDRKAGLSEISRVVLTCSGELIQETWNATKQCWQKDAKCRPKKPKHEGLARSAFIIAIVTVFAAISLLVGFYFLRKRKLEGRGENLLNFDVEMSLKHISKKLPELNQKQKKGRKKASKLLFFSFSSVSKATDNFSDANKVGQGGFGPVYKGTLLNGNEVAVKRLSKNSPQGKQQLKTEANLIARLQHKNLVRVLGCCVQKKEQILIYEYMSNKSLDFFLFDSTRRRHLKWPMRARIVEGIAQGLLYLHKYSRIKIIHRDLKPANVLLDNDMNPKISDFGLARIFSIGDMQEGSARPVGTFGYMSPEAGRHGIFSEKSDIYSFGVLFLEILSGKKNTATHSPETASLVAYAWELWRSDRSMELLDPLVEEDQTVVRNVLRYVRIALLCVQALPADRPLISQVLSMLCNSNEPLPYPNQPGFLDSTSFARSRPMDNGAAEARPENISANDMSLSSLEPR